MDIDTDDEKLPPDDDFSESESDSDAADGDYNPEESSSEDSQSTEDMEDDDFKLSEEEEEHDYDVGGDFFEEDVEQQQENVEKDKFGWRGNFFFSNFYLFTVNMEFIEEIVLKDYQVAGIKYLKDVLQDPKRGGAILADEMGLGKTSK